MDRLINSDYRPYPVTGFDDCSTLLSVRSEDFFRDRNVRRPDVVGFRGATIRTEFEFRGLVVPRGMTLDFSHAVVVEGARLRFVDCRAEGMIDLSRSDIRGSVEFSRITAPWVDGRPIAIDLREAPVFGEVVFAGIRSTKGAKTRGATVELSSVLLDRRTASAHSPSQVEDVRQGRIVIVDYVEGSLLFQGDAVVNRSDSPVSLRGSTWRDAKFHLAIADGVHPRRIDASNMKLESASITLSIGPAVPPATEGANVDLSRIESRRSGLEMVGQSLKRVDARALVLAESAVALSGIEVVGAMNHETGCFVDIAVHHWEESKIHLGGYLDFVPWKLNDNDDDVVVRVEAPLELGSSTFSAVFDEQGEGRAQFALNDEQVSELESGTGSAGNLVRERTVLSWKFVGWLKNWTGVCQWCRETSSSTPTLSRRCQRRSSAGSHPGTTAGRSHRPGPLPPRCATPALSLSAGRC